MDRGEGFALIVPEPPLSLFCCRKSILTEYVTLSDTVSKESAQLHKAMKESVSTIIPKKEYKAFVEANQ